MKSKTTIIALASFFILASCTGKSKKVNEAALWDEKPQQTQTVTAKAETPETETVAEPTIETPKTQVAETVVEPTVETKMEKAAATVEKPIEKKAENLDEETDDNKIYERPEQSAEISISNSECMKIWNENFRYSDYLIKNKINGSTNAIITVEKDGSISDVVIPKSIHPDFDNEAIRVIKLFPNFIPAKKDGKPVRSKVIWPVHIRFKEQ